MNITNINYSLIKITNDIYMAKSTLLLKFNNHEIHDIRIGKSFSILLFSECVENPGENYIFFSVNIVLAVVIGTDVLRYTTIYRIFF